MSFYLLVALSYLGAPRMWNDRNIGQVNLLSRACVASCRLTMHALGTIVHASQRGKFAMSSSCPILHFSMCSRHDGRNMKQGNFASLRHRHFACVDGVGCAGILLVFRHVGVWSCFRLHQCSAEATDSMSASCVVSFGLRLQCVCAISLVSAR